MKLLSLIISAIPVLTYGVDLVSWGGDYVTVNQNSQAVLQDFAGVPTALDSIRQVGDWGAALNPVISVDYDGSSAAFTGGAQVVKFGVNASNGAATAKVIDSIDGDYIELFAQSPAGTTNSHMNYVAMWDLAINYDDLTGISGATAGGVSGTLVSRFIIQTVGGDYYLSNTTISGGNGGATWAIPDLSTELWALYIPGTDNWRGNYDSLSFDTSLTGTDIQAVGWHGARDSGVAGFTNATLTIREFLVTGAEDPVLVDVILETSTDLQNWEPTSPGTFDISGGPRFFRVNVVPQ
ncbi:MAG: hypothetical protein ACP5I4_14195 [Oceanipulchritudo sp.]